MQYNGTYVREKFIWGVGGECRGV